MTQQSKTPYDDKADAGIPSTGGDVSGAAGDASDPTSGSGPVAKKKGFGFSSRGSASSGGGLSNSSSRPSGGFGASSSSKKPGYASGSDLAEAENKEGGGLYKDDSDSKRDILNLKKAFTRKNAKRGGIVAGLSAVLIGGGGGLYMSLAPLKVEHMVSNMRQRFFSSSENALEKQTDRLLGRYIIKHVLPSYKRCKGGTINKSCRVPTIDGTNPVSRLYRTWSDVRLENKLATSYGIEFEFNNKSNSWKLKSPGIDGDVDIGKDGEKFDSIFRESGRSEMRSAIREATANETRWKKTYVRYKVGGLLERKYGIKRCIVFCGTRDKANDSIDNKKNKVKHIIADRVLKNRASMMGAVMECLIEPTCKPEDTDPPTEAGTDGTESDFDSEARAERERIAGEFKVEPDELSKSYKEISEKGYKAYMLDKMLVKIGISASSKTALKAVPYVGWVFAGADVINVLNHAGPAIKKLSYATNAAASVQLFMTYSTYADEIHTGEVDPRVVGSFNDSLGSGNKGTDVDPAKGGTANAEITPLYQDIMNNKQSRARNITLNDGLFKSASAAAPYTSVYPKGSYTCDGDKPVPEGKKVCDEEVLGKGSTVADDVSAAFDQPGMAELSFLAEQVGKVSGVVGDVANKILQKIPGVEAAGDKMAELINPIMENLINKVIPDPFGTSMSGGRTFNMMAAGADVAGNEYAQNGLGGQKLTNEEVAQIRNEQLQNKDQEFARKSFYARTFDTDSDQSMVSRVAIAMPFGKQSQMQSGFASLANPLKTVSSGLASMFSGRAFAEVDVQDDPFGVVQYGYPEGTIPDDAEAYWDANCVDDGVKGYKNDNSWYQAAADSEPDEKTGMPVNTTTNPCMLIKAATGALGGAYDQSNLTEEDLANLSGSEDSGASESAGGTIDMATLYESSVDIACADGTEDAGVQDGYTDGNKVKIRTCTISNAPSAASDSVNGKLVMNSRVSKVVFDMFKDAKAAGVDTTVSSGFRTFATQQCLAEGGCGSNGTATDAGYSNHQMGIAMDADGALNAWLQKNGEKYGFKWFGPGDDIHFSPNGR